jgi:hypothetical protein
VGSCGWGREGGVMRVGEAGSRLPPMLSDPYTCVSRRLGEAGFPMLSAADSSHRRFGAA